MLTCFNLKPGETIDAFRDALAELTAHLAEEGLVDRVGPIGLRQRDTIMDTDDERDHQYFFIMTFKDREQCDRSVQYMYQEDEPADTLHKRTYSKITDPVFISWVDI
jgi:hypothetical protein